MPTQETTYKQGDTFFNPKTGKAEGAVEFDANTGDRLPTGGTTTPKNQLIVTGSKPASDFAQYKQDLTQAINKGSYTPAPQPPAGWDPTTYANFKAANPTLEPTPEDTAKMRGTASAGGANIDSPYAGMDSYSDSYTQMLDKIGATSDKATQNLIATIKAQKQNRMSTINQETDRLKSGLMSLGLETGDINFTPDLVYGKIAQAENARASKLMELDRDEATALLEAQQASENDDLDVLKEKMDYYKSIKKTRLDILKESYDTMATEAKIGELQATQIYDELQKLPSASKLPFLQELASRYDIPIAALTSQVSEITRDRAKKATGSGTGGSSVKSTIAALKSNVFTKKKDANGYSVVGADGFVDPDVYIRAYEQFPGTNKEWLAAFPATGWVNPKSYANLPEALRPAAKKTSTSTGDRTLD